MTHYFMTTQNKPLRKRRMIATAIALSFSGLALAAVGNEIPKLSAEGYKIERVLQELPMPKISDKQLGSSYWYDEEVQTGDNLTFWC